MSVFGVFEPGDELGDRYRIEQLLGQGGMGRVYKAYDKELERTIALKVLQPELVSDPGAMQRFKQELLLASRISHKNILRIHDLGEADGVKFISMAFVEGEDLHHLLRTHGRLPVDRALKIAEQLCEALDAAHSEGVVHRDLKPQNVLMGKNDQVYVVDFGLAKSLESSAAGMTRTGQYLGTPRYMAPEQVEAKPVDSRTDLYALGLIFFEMLTGEEPFKGESTLQTMYRRVKEKAPNPKDLNSEIPDFFARIILRCMERDPARRYQNARDILADLQTGHAPSRAKTMQISLPALERKGRLIAAGVVAAILLISALAFFGWKRAFKPKPAQAPVSVLVADFTNDTGDPNFDGTLEPMLNVALEGASFITAYERGTARKFAERLPHPTEKLDEQAARLVAIGQGISAIITGGISQRGGKYDISAMVLDAVTGKVITKTEVTAESKDGVLRALPELAAPIRRALGDTTPESVQLEAVQGAFTTSSLEAVHDYGVGMDQQYAGNLQGAVQSFSKAVALDSTFARAYAGMAAVSYDLSNLQDAEKYAKLALEHIDRMTERERYRVRGFYYMDIARDFPKCIEENTELVKLYPSDNVGHLNLGVCYTESQDYAKAAEEYRRAVEIYPDAVIPRVDLSITSSYAGDFKTAEQQARAVLQLNPSFDYSYFALAYAQLGQGQIEQATETYEKLQKLSPQGASMGVAGLADLALYEGRFSDAVRMLENGASADLATKNSRAMEKFAALAYTQLSWGHNRQAVEAAQRALSLSQKVNIRFLMARILVETGEETKARALAAGLASEPSPEAEADAKLIEGEAALKSKDTAKAIQLFTEAQKVRDTWMGGFDLGRAYLDAGLYVEADSEFDNCITKRGQALELFDGPTYGYFPPVYYYQGRVREGLKSPGAADSYKTYLNIRGKAGEDPLLPDIRQRLSRLGLQ